MHYDYMISQNYVKNWGIWEAVREILQNAFDAGNESIVYHECAGYLKITNPGSLDHKILLLGFTEKEENSIGQFGEGLKLAMLVAARLGRKMLVLTGQEQWRPYLKDFQDTNEKILCIESAQYFSEFVSVEIEITKDEWVDICKKYLTDRTPRVLGPEFDKGMIFVGGIFITQLANFEHSYNFSPKNLTINRDRDIPSHYDIQKCAIELLPPSETINIIRTSRDDVGEWSLSYSPKARDVALAWEKENPEAVPIGISQQSKLTAKKPVYLPDWFAKLLQRTLLLFPHRKDERPACERLVAWSNKSRKIKILSSSDWAEFDLIIEALKENEQ